MRNYHKLQELHNNGVKIGITNRYNRGDSQPWNISADKSAEGVVFSIDRYYETIEEGIEDLHTTWTKLTGAMPEHRLNILEHRPFNPDDPAGDEWLSRARNNGIGTVAEETLAKINSTLDTLPLGVYYVPDHGFFDLKGSIKGADFYNTWNKRWAEFPQKTYAEHAYIANKTIDDEIPY